MQNFENISMQSVGETLRKTPDRNDAYPMIVCSGKGGVGKSTVAAAIGYHASRQGAKIFGLDLDGSPSLATAFGHHQHANGLRNEVQEISTGANTAICTAVLTDLFPNVREEFSEANSVGEFEKQYEGEFNRIADKLLPEMLESRQTFLPILRLILTPMSWGIPVQTTRLAHIIQLAEIYGNNRHIVSDFTYGNEETVADSKSLKDTETVLIDTENSNNFLGLMRHLKCLVFMMRSMSKKDGNFLTKSVAKVVSQAYPIFRGYNTSALAKDPSKFIQATSKLHETLMGDQSTLLFVTNPGATEVDKTMADIRGCIAQGKAIGHVIMNRWPSDKKHQNEAEILEENLLGQLNALGIPLPYTRVETDGLEIVSPEDPKFPKIQQKNLEKIRKGLGL